MMNVTLADEQQVYMYKKYKYFYQTAHYLILQQIIYRNISSCIVLFVFSLMSSEIEYNKFRVYMT